MILYARLLRSYPFESDDFQWVYQRIPGYFDALRDGQFPPRIFPNAFDGGGYAFAHFYPPISHWVATGFAALTGSPVWGVHLSFYASVVLASVAMFRLGRALTGSALLGAVAAVIYTALPYHIVDVYLRGALAESWSFVWFPLIVHAGVSSVRAGRVTWVFPLAVAGLILTHTLIALYFACALGLALLWVCSCYGYGVALRLLAGGIVGASLSLWYILPTQAMLEGVWASVPELMQTSEEAVRRAAPRPGSAFFLLDLPPWFMVFVALKVLIQERRALAWESIRDVAGLLLLALGFSVYAYLPGLYQWLLPSIFAYVQFPWRVFAITGFLCTLLAILLARAVGGTRLPVFFLVAACSIALPYAIRMGGGERPVDGRQVAYHADGATTYTVVGDYLPRPILLPQALEALQQVRSEAASIGVVFDRNRGAIRAHGPRGGTEVVFPLFHYPLYRAETKQGQPLTVLNRGGFVAVQFPDGSDSVVIRVSNPRTFWWGLALGVATSLFWCVLVRREKVWGDWSAPSRGS